MCGSEWATRKGAAELLDLVTLEGRCVLLEPLSLDHVPDLLRAATQSRATYDLTDVPSDEADMRRYVDKALSGRDSGNMFPFATIDRATGRVVGSTRFGNIESWNWPVGNPHQRGEHLPDVVEIGWTWLAPDAQRTGINAEAKLLMLTHAFESWMVHRVSFRTDRRNERSRVAVERLGARFDGVVRAAQIAYDGTIRDSAVYSILDSEWPEVKERIEGRLRRNTECRPSRSADRCR
jgi:RimJ/RimL family protein N-acetyltransferase